MRVRREQKHVFRIEISMVFRSIYFSETIFKIITLPPWSGFIPSFSDSTLTECQDPIVLTSTVNGYCLVDEHCRDRFDKAVPVEIYVQNIIWQNLRSIYTIRHFMWDVSYDTAQKFRIDPIFCVVSYDTFLVQHILCLTAHFLYNTFCVVRHISCTTHFVPYDTIFTNICRIVYLNTLLSGTTAIRRTAIIVCMYLLSVWL
jgi:hypothetical protein